MKKIKISELDLYESLEGLYTIGTDADNNSVKVSLEFLGEAADEATSAAETANEAAETANTAASAANTAASSATTAASSATSAASAANTAASSATIAASSATTAASAANTAASSAETAVTNAETVTAWATAAGTAAEEATEAANEATTEVLSSLSSLVPTALSVTYPASITYGNVEPQYVTVELSPEDCPANVLYLSDGVAVTVHPTTGLLSVVAVGRSVVYVIPTLNTALAKAIVIEVVEPTLRLVDSSTLRLTGDCSLRLN